ncbi:hypothetical protein BH23BAC3_BH23BAC3_09560 [soil metagenome]
MIEPLLFDADFYVKDLPQSLKNGDFNLKIKRPYWEKPIKKKTFFFKKTLVKAQFSIVSFKTVFNFNYNWNNNAFDSPDDQHSIHNVNFDKNKNIFLIKSEHLNISIKLKNPIQVTVEDLGEPSKNNMLNINGWNTFNYSEWANKIKD